TKTGWVVAVDQAGDVAWYYKSEEPIGDIRDMGNGNLICNRTDGRLVEIDREGNIQRHWYATGKWESKTPPAGGIPIEAPAFHHCLVPMKNGNLLVTSIEIRRYDDWPGSDSDPDAPTESANLVGDVIMEVTPEGKTVNEWRFLDMLDPYRICYGSRSGYWAQRGFTGSFDWCHTNCIFYDASDDTILASLRTQDCMIKFSRGDGSLKWILGTPENWRQPWADKLLKPEGALDWQYHQHDCSVTPTGTILCFDNANHQATPFQPEMPPADNTSRIVEFAVDEATGTVRQVWSHGTEPDYRIFACYQGGAIRLPETGNTFMSYGGICTIDGAPSEDVGASFCRACLREVTPGGEVVFELWIDDSNASEPRPYSVFRSAHLGA
ncbi:MAG: aryl-sulfate sulfotransferase, partial [Rhodospirillales bacterium]|nr:aryl-sulfate sulfotransferase [Rhodospirillales bacterium]